MATNGASARQWLAEHGSHKSLSEIERIRAAIAGKLETLAEDHPEQEGLLEALDVMDEWISQNSNCLTVTSDCQSEYYQLDASSLTPDVDPLEELTPEEKQARFQNLLRSSKLP